MAAARAALSRHFGYPDFRPAQAPVIRSILAGSDTLAVLPTGAGKSVCFQIPAAVLGGLTVVVSPLISLMQDQVAAAEGRGISAACLTSGLTAEEQGEVRKRAFGGELRLLYLSPERLERFAVELREAGVRPALLAVDEAHCIAEWGHDFRPSYRTLLASRYRLGHPPAVALTGSATPAVRKEIARALGFTSGRVRRAPRLVRPRQSLVRCRSSERRPRPSPGAARAHQRRRPHGDRLCADPERHRGRGSRPRRGRASRRAVPRRARPRAPRRHPRCVPGRPARRRGRHLRLRHGHRQAYGPAGGALDAPAHARVLLPGSGARRT